MSPLPDDVLKILELRYYWALVKNVASICKNKEHVLFATDSRHGGLVGLVFLSKNQPLGFRGDGFAHRHVACSNGRGATGESASP